MRQKKNFKNVTKNNANANTNTEQHSAVLRHGRMLTKWTSNIEHTERTNWTEHCTKVMHECTEWTEKKTQFSERKDKLHAPVSNKMIPFTMHMYLAVDINFHSQLHSSFFLTVQRRSSTHRVTDISQYNSIFFFAAHFWHKYEWARVSISPCVCVSISAFQYFWCVLHNDRYLSAFADHIFRLPYSRRLKMADIFFLCASR